MISERIKNLAPSATFAIDMKAKEMAKNGVDVINFSVGEPDFDTPKSIKEAGIRAIEEGFTKYTPAGGILELREAIRRKLERENKLFYDISEIVVSPGAKFSLFALFQCLINPGDEVIVLKPYWVSYPEQIKLAGGIPVFVDTTSDFQLDLEAIKKNINGKTKAIVINSPNNPSGAVFKENDLRELAKIAENKGTYIISDEVYEKLVYGGAKHASIAEFYKNKTIVVNGVSKTYAMTGWRIGYMAGPGEIIKAVISLQSQSSSGSVSISQKAAREALDNDREHEEMVKEFEKRKEYIVERLNKIKGIKCAEPEGAFYAFPDVSLLGTSGDVADLFLEKACVAVVPGHAFGSDRHVRFSYALSYEKIKEGMDRLEKLLN